MGSSVPPVNVQFQATGVPQVSAAFRQVSQQSQTFGNSLSRTFVQANGQVSSFGRQSIQAVNATGFAISQFAATGQTGFRSIASAVAGFSAFFGIGGLIASGVISTGLILTDFWNRQRREAREAAKELGDLATEAIARRRRDDPTEVPKLKLADNRQKLDANMRELEALVERRNRAIAAQTTAGASPELIARGIAGLDEKMAELQKERGQLLANETEGIRQLNDAKKKLEETENKEVSTLADAISARRANNSQLERANVLMGQARFVLEQTQNTNVADVETMARRASALKDLTALTDAFKKAQEFVTEAERKRRDAQADQVNQLAALSGMNKLTGGQLVQLQALYRQLTAELNSYGISLERTVQIEQLLQTVRKASLQAPPVGLMSTVDRAGPLLPGERPLPGRNGSAATLPAVDVEAARRRMDAAYRQTFARPLFDARALDPMQEMFAASFASVIAGGIVQGFALGLQQGGIGEGFRQMGAQILTGFGSILTQVGAKALEAALLSNTFFSALMANPVVAIGAAIGLTLLGQALGGRGGGGSRGGGFGTAANAIPIDIRRLIVDPNFRSPAEMRQQSPFTGRPLVVNSPEGQRVLAENSAGFQRRGG